MSFATLRSVLRYPLRLHAHRRVLSILPSSDHRACLAHLHHHRHIHTTSAMAAILNGKDLADEVRTQLKAEIDRLSLEPTLVIVQVGDRDDSNVYIRMKTAFANSVGVRAVHLRLPKQITEQELASEIQKLNKDRTVHGVITQLPLDSVDPIDSHYIINIIDPAKDVDCLTAVNAGNLMHGLINEPFTYLPCTPHGCLQLIQKTGVQIAGAKAVVIGRSKIVGAPMAQLLIWHDATVTLCHKKTKDLASIVRQAEILVVAVGCPRLVKKDWVRPGAVVIDCGITSIDDPTRKAGYRLVGDVDYDEVKDVASFITPVPGGVGPMTVAMLITNTVKAAQRAAAAVASQKVLSLNEHS